MMRTKQLLLATGLALLLCASGPALANESEIAALEARVAELEAIVRQLVELQKSPTAAPEPAAVPELAAVPAATSAPAASSAPGLSWSDEVSSDYAFGGYVKFDAMYSDYSDGRLSSDSPGGQFYIPATIPVGGDGDSVTTFQARESRINFKSDHHLPNGKKASTYIEVDFFLDPDGNERVSNSFHSRLRHAFFKYDKWLFGQTWSTFQDIGALPENLDFIGPSESTVFVRQAQVRYTRGPWEFALENPETTLTVNGDSSREIGRDKLPDIAARYTANVGNGGYIKAAGLVRQLLSATESPDESETAFGLSISGKHPLGYQGSDLRWMATYGEGTGRYLGLNTANDAAVTATGGLDAIEQFGAFISLRQVWNDKWRSNFTYGFLQNDHNMAHVSDGVTKDVYSIHANLLTSPMPKLTVGGEVVFVERELESGEKGDMTRFLLSAKYAF